MTSPTSINTIVSAFITGVNQRKDLDISQYIEFGKKLLLIDVPKVIFIEEPIYQMYFEKDSKLGTYPKTIFIMMKRFNIYLYDYKDLITNFDIHSSKPEKDTIDFLFVQCNKTEWVRTVVKNNPFKTEQFVWLDFGIYHIVRNDMLFEKTILHISQTECSKVSICSCWNLRLPFVRNIHKDVAWYFAGGIFGGEPEYLIKFADKMKEKTIKYIQEQKSLVWETNLWYLIYKENPEIFTPYLADHNACMIQNYGIQSNGLILVTAIFKPWTDDMKEYLYFLGDLRCPLYLFISDTKSMPIEVVNFITETYPEITIVSFENPWLYLMNLEPKLPIVRNLEKDTAEHILNMHSKIYCLKRAVELSDTTPFSYVWIDFGIKDICSSHDKPLQTFIYELSCRTDLNFPLDENMMFPGCWQKIDKSNFDTMEKTQGFLNHICWRFAGGIMWGNHLAIRRFWKLYQKYLPFLIVKYGILTWEVNFWAWLETMDPKWNPIWYPGDHNDSIVNIPGRLWSAKLNTHTCISTVKNYEIADYQPMSAAYLFYKEKHYLNTRYTNYHVCSDGYYWWPPNEDRIIRNKNILSELNDIDLSPKSFIEMKNEVGLTSFPGRFSEGIEDIRLFENVEGNIGFIGSTLEYSFSGRIRMIIGEYDIENGNGVCKNGKMIEPPTDTHCEKNWIPIKDNNSDVWFIYKWHPMQIGKIINGSHLEIQKTYDTSTIIFGKIRGSSCFIEDTIEGVNGLVGVVHFSEELYPRQYFHRLVLLEKHTFKPLKYTDPFYFNHLGIEFCIGFMKKEMDYVFWISKMDRDPFMVKVNRFSCPRWNSCGRWGV